MKTTTQSVTPLVITGAIALLIFVVGITLWRAGSDSVTTPEGEQYVQEVLSDIPQYNEISTSTLQKRLRSQRDAIGIIDIRSADRYTTEHIVSAINFPAKQLLAGGIATSYNKQTLIVVTSNITQLDLERAVAILSETNPNVLVLTGGMKAWKIGGGGTISIGNPNKVTDVVKVSYISIAELRKIVTAKDANKDFRHAIIDVRPEADFARGSIAHAINIPLAKLELRVSELPSTKHIIVYGATPLDSFRAGVRINDLGFLLTQTLDGGYSDWTSEK